MKKIEKSIFFIILLRGVHPKIIPYFLPKVKQKINIFLEKYKNPKIKVNRFSKKFFKKI